MRCVLNGVAALTKVSGIGFRTMSQDLRDAHERRHEKLCGKTASNEGFPHAPKPRRSRLRADVPVLVAPDDAAGKIVRVSTAAAEPLFKEPRCLFDIEVRERFAQPLVLLDATIQVRYQRGHAIAVAYRLAQFRARVRNDRFPAMPQFIGLGMNQLRGVSRVFTFLERARHVGDLLFRPIDPRFHRRERPRRSWRDLFRVREGSRTHRQYPQQAF